MSNDSLDDIKPENLGQNVIKIGMCAPPRVGKTTLITSIYQDFTRFLAGSPLTIEPVGTTEERLNRRYNDLKGSIKSGKICSGVLGDHDATAYVLDIKMKKRPWLPTPISRWRNLIISFAILDYPGGWLNNKPREIERWEICKRWIEDSMIFIIPVDAGILMHADSKNEIQAREKVLNIAQTEALVRKWANERVNSGKEPGLLIISPVKCESYFSDNKKGGISSVIKTSEELKKEVLDLYGGVIEAAKSEYGDKGKNRLRIKYYPIDTIGCSELSKWDWIPSEYPADPADLIFKPEYGVRQKGVFSPFGPGDLMLSICQHILELKEPGKIVKSHLPTFVKLVNNVSKLLDELGKIKNARNEELRKEAIYKRWCDL